MHAHPIQTISVRIPVGLFESLKSIASAEKVSFNGLAVRALQRCADELRDQETKEAFVARAARPVDLGYAEAAQAEVALANPQ